MPDTSPEPLYNVVAINIATGEKRLLAENKTLRNAEAIVAMAVMRRGVETECYATEPVT